MKEKKIIQKAKTKTNILLEEFDWLYDNYIEMFGKHRIYNNEEELKKYYINNFIDEEIEENAFPSGEYLDDVSVRFRLLLDLYINGYEVSSYLSYKFAMQFADEVLIKQWEGNKEMLKSWIGK